LGSAAATRTWVGAFAEVILQELARETRLGVVTTHYLNLKVMAGKTAGIINGAMGFDEKKPASAL
jgi:DNA mismatch repair protein MutS2